MFDDDLSDDEYLNHLLRLFAALDSGRDGLVMAAYVELNSMSSERINRIMGENQEMSCCRFRGQQVKLA